jgi:putative heme-binding domain-containing protein
VAQGPAPAATPAEKLKVLKGFKAELIHAVPRDSEGSWVSLTTDPKGRLIASDQYGKLFRITPPPVGQTGAAKVEPMAVEIGEAQGLCWAFDSLYVVVNAGTGKYPSGLYRARDTDGDDNLDKVELLRKLDGGGEHGPHAVILSPDGKSLYVVAGNATRVPELAGSLVPRDWGEDTILPRMPDGNGFMADEKAPGGFICKVDPDGKDWTLVAMGFRNPYDIAFNKYGDLFTYDSDMEWDFLTPWYRPTRVCNAVSGADFGYRGGSGKFPTYFYDSLPPVVDIGPGSPTGIGFGYGAKFPKKYQDALYICDWSYGKLYAVHNTPIGASYKGEAEEFVTASPLPLTDVVIHPTDGAMYFTVGGRRTTSALYRVTYIGDAAEEKESAEDSTARDARHKLEAFHGHADPKAVDAAWPYLSSPDRFVRYAARVALEFQPVASWREKALTETNPQATLEALLALVRVSAQDPAHRDGKAAQPDSGLQSAVLGALGRIDWNALTHTQRVDAVRLLQVLFVRTGKPDPEMTEKVVARLNSHYPSKSPELNSELCPLLVYLEAPDVAAKTMGLIAKATTQEEQLDYAKSLRVLKTGWTPELRKAYFTWLQKAHAYKGGASFRGFLNILKRDSVNTLSESERADLKPLLNAPAGPAAAATVARPHVKDWTMEELVPLVESGLKSKRDFDRGRLMFGAAQCTACHRFGIEGGAAGPDLTGVSGRFNTRDLLESIVVPNKVISDQYGAVSFLLSDGQVITGRVANLNGDNIMVVTNMLDPGNMANVDRHKIEETKPSPVSMMPQGLLNTLNREEVLDLMAYLLSKGDRNAEVYRQP